MNNIFLCKSNTMQSRPPGIRVPAIAMRSNEALCIDRRTWNQVKGSRLPLFRGGTAFLVAGQSLSNPTSATSHQRKKCKPSLLNRSTCSQTAPLLDFHSFSLFLDIFLIRLGWLFRYNSPCAMRFLKFVKGEEMKYREKYHFVNILWIWRKEIIRISNIQIFYDSSCL